MALKQEITSVTGATTTYHRISDAIIYYTQRKAHIIVQSYIDEAKRDEEKKNAQPDKQRAELMAELQPLVEKPTDDNEDKRNELSQKLNKMELQSPKDLTPRNISDEHYDIDLPDGVDFTLEYAYQWLKENVYTEAEDLL